MTTTIYGDEAAFVLTDTINATAVVPANGEPVDAVPPAATVKTLLDHIASTARQAYDETIYGVGKILASGNVASIRARTGMTEGDVIMLLDPDYSGGASGLVSGVSLYVYSPSSTAPETIVPNVPNGYLVIEPTVGGGAWLNVACGLGFTLGSLPTFVPRPIDRIKLRYAEGFATGNVATAATTLVYVPVDASAPIELSAVAMAANDLISLDCSFNTSSATSGTQQYTVCLEYKQGVGGTWQKVLGSEHAIFVANNTEVPVHLGGVVQAAGSANFYFRVALYGTTGQTINVSKTWSFRSTSYSAI